MKRLLASITASAIIIFARLITAVRGIWLGVEPGANHNARVYFANHRSHGDFVLLWTVLPPRQRNKTRPVAGKDYWASSALKRFIGVDVFHSLLIERNSGTQYTDAEDNSNIKREGESLTPMEIMQGALDAGDSLILFPEGTRNMTDEKLLPFKSGLYRLAKSRPNVDLIPVWINNLNRVLPKGEFIPVPLVCTVTFGEAVHLNTDETKQNFLDRAERALLALAPTES